MKKVNSYLISSVIKSLKKEGIFEESDKDAEEEEHSLEM